MTRELYCSECGAKLQIDSKKEEAKKIFKRKTTRIISVVFIFLVIAIPAIVTPLARRAQYQGIFSIVDVNIIDQGTSEDLIELTLQVIGGKVRVEQLHLFSLDELTRYFSAHEHFVFEEEEILERTYIIHKDQLPPLDVGFRLHIEYRYNEQWLTFLF